MSAVSSQGIMAKVRILSSRRVGRPVPPKLIAIDPMSGADFADRMRKARLRAGRCQLAMTADEAARVAVWTRAGLSKADAKAAVFGGRT